MDTQNNGAKKVKSITPFTIILILIAIAFVVFVGTSFFVVDETEQAVITRFGKYYKTLDSGLQFKLPFGIDKNYNVPVKVVQTEQFGFKTLQSGTRSQYQNGITKESTMLTGDLNIVDVEWIIQYRIVDSAAWLFNVQDRTQPIRDISQSVVNTLVGDRAILDVMSTERTNIEIQAQEILRIKKTLNEIMASNTGQSIKKIEKDTDRDYIMTPQEALEYGMIDKVITKDI